MNKNILKVKNLLHLDLFTRIIGIPSGRKNLIYMGDSEDGGDPQLLTAIYELGSKYMCEASFIGPNKSIFIVECAIIAGGALKCWIHQPRNSNRKHATMDLPLFKEFIKKQHKKASHG